VDEIIHPREKIKTVAELGPFIAEARAGGKQVALANGCFDLLHVGHVRYLQAARALADTLIVAINDDSSVRLLKGEGRPLQPQCDRAEILASLACVDFVVIFDTPTVAPVLEALHPDFHAKGTDYSEETVPERQTVASYGGRTVIVGDRKSHSSRDLIARITTSAKQQR
jgi:D-glycero-beta-D-manno-heptose 1-phosphate adenylyltransferase